MINFFKRKRKVDKPLLEAIRDLPCIVCSGRPCDAAHIQSRGAGGGDTLDNVLPFCRSHHIHQHHIGWVRFALMYPEVMEALIARGWEIVIDQNRRKFRRVGNAES